MKKFYWLIIVVALALISIITIAKLKPVTRYQTHRSASRYYRHLAAGEFEKAFEYVAYYDEYSDLEPAVLHEDAKKVWVGRVKEMRQSGLYFAEVERIQVLIDDGYPMGKAYVTIVDQGVKTRVTQNICFARHSGTWRVQVIRTDSDCLTETIASLDKAISGHIPQISKKDQSASTPLSTRHLGRANQSPTTDGKIFPGLRILSGSKARLIRRWSPISAASMTSGR